MLTRINIENIALIDRLSVGFDAGFNIVSGETGAGKSILIQAVSLLMGGPAGQAILKDKKIPGKVEGKFKLRQAVDEEKIPAQYITQKDLLLLRREVYGGGRNRYFINNQQVPRRQFRTVGTYLLNINSQHSNQFLLNESNHGILLDDAIDVSSVLIEVKKAFDALVQSGSDYEKKRRQLDELLHKKRLYEYQIKEIDAADLKQGEKERLVQERERIRYAQEIRSSLTEALDLCDDDSELNRIVDHVDQCLSKATRRDNQITTISETWKNILLYIQDVKECILGYLEIMETIPGKLDEIMARLHFLQDMEAKYQTDIAGIIEYKKRISNAVRNTDELKEKLASAEKNWRKKFNNFKNLCDKLSLLRQKEAPVLSRKIESALANVGMKQAKFHVEFLNMAEHGLDPPSSVGTIPAGYSERGYDQVRFMLSANPGIPLKPLAKIASGGELSRIMLALRQHFFKRQQDQTIVFDEVDSGIGGTIAGVVGKQLKKLSEKHQVICVTHLPQIAALADKHLMVRKSFYKNLTTVDIRSLKKDERIKEIARMLSGNAGDKTALNHAQKLLNDAVS